MTCKGYLNCTYPQISQSDIDRTSGDFFAAVSTLFGSDYSGNQYTGVLSIFDCNPRYVEEKKFQVFYLRDRLGRRAVAYHEILHFIFFEHAAKHCSQVVSSLDTNSGAYWALSEIYNVIILNRPEFQHVLEREEHMFYPTLRPYVDDVRLLHAKSANFCEFLTASVVYLNREAGRKK